MDDPRKNVYVLDELKKIPIQLWDIIGPRTLEGFTLYLKNIKRWLTRSKTRKKVMQLQKQYGLPLRPNQSLKEVQVRINIVKLQEKKNYRDSDDLNSKL